MVHSQLPLVSQLVTRSMSISFFVSFIQTLLLYRWNFRSFRFASLYSHVNCSKGRELKGEKRPKRKRVLVSLLRKHNTPINSWFSTFVNLTCLSEGNLPVTQRGSSLLLKKKKREKNEKMTLQYSPSTFFLNYNYKEMKIWHNEINMETFSLETNLFALSPFEP